MEMPAAIGNRTVPNNPVLAAAGRFGRFKPEEEQRRGVQKTDQDPALMQLLELWHRFNACPKHPFSNETNYIYSAIPLVKNWRFSAEQIRKFTIALAAFVNESVYDEFFELPLFVRYECHHPENFSLNAGTFISALMNYSPDIEFTIPTGNLPNIDFLGYRNSKSIIIEGDIGKHIGRYMTSGKIIIHGSAESYAASYMSGGRIIVMGDVTDGAGLAMKGGFLVIEGNAGASLGQGLRGGEIRVNGDIESIEGDSYSQIEGGRIFHKGILIVDK